MIYRVVLDDTYDLHTSDIDCMLLNPSLELEMNSAGSFNFTLPPTHPYWDSIEILKSTIDVYEDDDLIFTGRVANIDKNWNNERVVECEGALAYFNDSIHRQMKWETPLPIASEDPTVHNFLKDILDNHNVFVGDAVNRQIHIGHIYVDPYLVTREVDYDTTLDILTRMCIDTNGGYFMIRKDPETHLLYLDWLKDFTEESGQPASFGVNLLDFNTGLHAADICTGVLARGATVNDQVVTLSNVELVDETTYPDMSVDHYTDHDQDILWHREGMDKFGRVVQVHEFPDAQTDWKNGEQVVANSLFEEARKWLEEKNTKVESIEVEVAELSWLREGVPKYKLGQIVEILDDAHMAGEPYEVRRLPMYKLSCDLSSGSKKVTLGRPPKKELTQISASNSDSSTLSSGNSSGSSSGGGSGEDCKVHDVRVDGTSVVSDKIANISLTGKADTSTVNALAATVATKADTATVTALANVVSGKQNQIEFNTQEAATEVLTRLKADDKVYNLGGGTEVEANPSESATDDLNTIKIGDTVYDIPGGGGSSTNYGKFKCDTLFTQTDFSIDQSTSDKIRSYTLSKSIDDYDALVISAVMCFSAGHEQYDSRIIYKPDFNYSPTYPNQDEFSFVFSNLSTPNNDRSRFLCGYFSDSTHIVTNCTMRTQNSNELKLYKVYGLKFENKLINRSDIYSEEERMIGRWTDGKPLYQKTFHYVETSEQTNKVYYLSSYNIENAFVIDKLMKLGNIAGYTWASEDQYYDGTYSRWLTFGKDDGNGPYINAVSNGWKYLEIYITLQYTKTTDTPDSGVIPEDPMFISDPMIFSEEEQVVGSWTDGKPLYQKTITISSVPYDSSWHEVAHNISDIDTIGSVEGVVTDSNGPTCYPANSYRPAYTIGVVIGADKTKIQYMNNWIGTASNLIVTLRYTKTTDSILSGPKKGKIIQRSDIYSEEERLVGRWTDGKPVYQKTWIKVVPSAHDYDGGLAYLIDSDVSYIDEMISGNGYLKETTVGAVSILNGGIPNMDGWSYGIHITGTKQLVLYGATRTTYVPGATAVITLQYTKTTDAPFSKQLIEDPQFVMMSDIYSEDEQVVGRWTDGKPVYQKTVIVSSGSLSSGSMNVSTTGIINVEKCIDWSCRLHSNSENRDFPIPYDRVTYSESIQCLVQVLADHTIGCTLHSGDRSSYNNIGDICITFKYTKTTDAPGTGPTKGNLIYLPALYSEEEREVGVWTDGKPLYQKCLTGTVSTRTSDWVEFGTVSNDVDAVIHLKSCFRYSDGSAIEERYITARYASGKVYYFCENIGNITGTGVIVIQYTKTTDQPGSGTWTPEGQLAHHYSTSEKVVGTWIDGSTIYERTWDFSASPISLPYDTWINTTIQSYDNVYHIISAECLTSGFLVMDGNEIVVGAGGYPVGICAKINHGRSLGYLTLRYIKSS